MNMRSDQELLEMYYQDRSESAFGELVRRHVDVVYSTAVRLLVDRQLAEDAVQQTFVALARHARALSRRQVVSGWLHRTTHNFAVMIIRQEERRRARERAAAAIADLEPDRVPSEEGSWAAISLHLDWAIEQLPAADRDSIALRFFERRTAADMGGLLGISEDAAQKRVRRALERLRRILAGRGVTVPVAGLSAVISDHVVLATPGPLVQSLIVRIGIAVGPVPSGFWAGVSQWIAAQPVAAAVVGLLAVSLGTGGYLAGRANALEHWKAVSWHNAMAMSSSPESLPEPVTPLVTPGPAAIIPSPAVARSSVIEVLAAAAAEFRNREHDPDAWAKGYMLMEQLRPEDVDEALRVLEGYRHEAAVYGSMAPLVIRVWAQFEPKRALDHALTHLEKDALGLPIEFATSSWAEQDPQAAWSWYRETSDAGKTPISDASWMWVPKHIFGAWAAHDPGAAIRMLQEIPYGERDNAIFGIAETAREPTARPGILLAIEHVADENQRRELARRVASRWAGVEPAAAAQWVSSLNFGNPAAKLSVMGEVAEEWWPIDRHAVTQWLLANAPREVMDRVQAGVAEMTRRSTEP